MKDKLKIKQFMTIPDNFKVLSTCEDLDKKTILFEPEKEGWTCLLILVEGNNCDDYITFYSIDQCGCGEVDEGAKLIRREYCPICNSEMKVHLLECTKEGALWYECSCGNKKIFDQEG